MLWFSRIALLLSLAILGLLGFISLQLAGTRDAGSTSGIELFVIPIALAATLGHLIESFRKAGRGRAGRYLTIGIAGVVGGPLLFFVSFRPPPNWNESGTIGDVRSVISAQAAYQSANLGHYDGRLECLSVPWECLHGYSPNGPTFLDPHLGSLQSKSGYTRTFAPGEPVPVDADASPRFRASETSVLTFAYIAVPAVLGKTGTRAFCGDSTGVICATRDGSTPVTENGQCVIGEDSFWRRTFGEGPAPCILLR